MPIRKKAWVEQLLTKRAAIEHAVGMPLGRMLGCGHWGCVFESEPPCVVKLSIDPTEGPIWSKIMGLIGEEQYGDGGFPEIRIIRRIMPDLVTGGRNRKVWAIVREGIEPVFKEYRAKELGHHGGGTMIATSEYTNAKLGLHTPTRPTSVRVAPGQKPWERSSFDTAISGLMTYREAATAWHVLGSHPRSHRQHEIRDYYKHELGFSSPEDAGHKALRITETKFDGPAWAPLGESLAMLASNGVYLRDVHFLNIGWHIARDDDDWDRVVIFDPGHTPTAGGGDIETVLVEEGREAL
jgi:hypothetical protein